MRPEAERWWKQSGRDLEAAADTDAAGHHFAAAFLGHQAAEKGLKALWIERRTELAPKTHVLYDLARPLGAPPEVDDACVEINEDYVTTRYPDAANGVPAEAFNARKSAEHRACAERILRWVESELSRVS